MLKKIPYILLYISITIMLIGCSNEDTTTSNAQEEQRTPVEVMQITKGSIIKTDTYSGQIQPIQEVLVNAKIQGEVKKVNFNMGDQVSKGAVLFVMDQKPIQNQIESLENQIASTTASYQYAEQNLENIKVLYDEGVVPKQEYDQMITVYEQAKASKDLLEIQLKNMAENLEDVEVRSPISGVVAERNIQPGEILGSNVTPFKILSVNTVYIDVNIPEMLINQIKPRKEVEVKVNAIPDKIFKGMVKQMSPIGDPMTHTYPIRIEIPNENQQIKVGMFAEASFELQRKEEIITVPRTALIKSGEEWYAFVVEDNIARKVAVEIGLDEGMILEVEQGLKEGDQLVIKGKEYISDGESVEIVEQ